MKILNKNRNINIAHCVEFYHPSVGGVQYHTKLLSEFLSSKYNITIMTTFDPKRKNKKIKNVKILEFKIKGNIVKGFSGETSTYQDELLKNKYDIILFYAAQQWTFDLALPILNKINSKKIFLPCGFSNIKNILYKPYYNLILKNKCKLFNKIICFSKTTNDYIFLKKNKISNNKIAIVSNGGNKFQKKVKKNNDNLLVVGNFNFYKNQLVIILASFFLKNKVTINFVYSKKNYYYNLCRFFSYYAHFFKKNVKYKFHYNLKRSKINELYVNSKLLVSTSIIECSPLNIIDCLTSGLDYISSNSGNVKELIEKNKCGEIYHSFFDLVNKIDNKLEQKINKNKIKKSYLWSNTLIKYQKIYQDILKKNTNNLY